MEKEEDSNRQRYNDEDLDVVSFVEDLSPLARCGHYHHKENKTEHREDKGEHRWFH